MSHNYDLQINPNTEPNDNPVLEALLFYWGDRFPDYEEGCPVCEAWKQYDKLITLAEANNVI
jgi:hypothetical protein